MHGSLRSSFWHISESEQQTSAGGNLALTTAVTTSSKSAKGHSFLMIAGLH